MDTLNALIPFVALRAMDALNTLNALIAFVSLGADGTHGELEDIGAGRAAAERNHQTVGAGNQSGGGQVALISRVPVL